MLNPINVPKAKPVKIRIMSGGEEHSSLDSLRHNFKLEDVKKLLDGRLVNWLNKIEEPELARKVSELQQTKIDDSANDENFSMKLIRLFFPDTYAETLKDVANEWMKENVYKDNATSLYKQLIWNDVDLVITLYKKHSFDFNWKGVFEHHYCNCSEKDLFHLGKELYEDNDTDEYKNLGERMIQKAAGLVYKAAVEYNDKIVNDIIERRKKKGYDEQVQEYFQKMFEIWKNSQIATDFHINTSDPQYKELGLLPAKNFMYDVLAWNGNFYDLFNKLTFNGKVLDPFYKEKALLLIIAEISSEHKIISKGNIERTLQRYSYDRYRLETYPLYQCIVGDEDFFSILTPNEIEILRSPQCMKEKILIIFEHLMDF